MLDLLNHQSYGSPSNTLVNEAGTVVGYSKIATVAYETVRHSALQKVCAKAFPGQIVVCFAADSLCWAGSGGVGVVYWIRIQHRLQHLPLQQVIHGSLVGVQRCRVYMESRLACGVVESAAGVSRYRTLKTTATCCVWRGKARHTPLAPSNPRWSWQRCDGWYVAATGDAFLMMCAAVSLSLHAAEKTVPFLSGDTLLFVPS